ncbi:MAG: Hpt domain-containing protein [Eubacteriales bacterium]|nr:Hpt domain-containing protein [Eubacteriales bacterium]MDD3881356.1 Hpt domain-containing protein [Eubacteriales bacterium]MDD4513043.1 Hpt domain-containing protein [Eubacteriales bacterium]
MDIFEQKLMLYGADVKRALARFGGDRDIYRECIRLLIGGDSFQNLKSAVSEENVNEAFNVAHAMKGAAGNLGLEPMLEAIGEVVEPLRGGEKMPDLSRAIAEIERQRKQLEGIIG